MSTPKQILQGLPIDLAQVQAGITSVNLQNEVSQIIYSLHWGNKVTEEVFNNIMDSKQL